MKVWVLGWGPAALWVAVLFLLSEASGTGAALPIGVDKVAHVGLYSILGLSLAWGRRSTGSGVSGLVLFLMGVGYAVLDEWHQSFVPGRDPSVGDWVADSAGVMLGLVFFSKFFLRVDESEPSEHGPSAAESITTTKTNSG